MNARMSWYNIVETDGARNYVVRVLAKNEVDALCVVMSLINDGFLSDRHNYNAELVEEGK